MVGSKQAWRVKEWCEATTLSRATVFALIADHKIDSVLVSNRCRLIRTPPGEYLDRFAAAPAASPPGAAQTTSAAA